MNPPQPAGVASLAYGANGDAKWNESKGSDKYRRGVYIFFQRATPYPLLMNFDAPKAVVTECRRERSDTPLQALNLLNDPVFLEAVRRLRIERLPMPALPMPASISCLNERLDARPPKVTARGSTRGSTRCVQSTQQDTADAAKLAPASLPGLDRAEAAAWVNLASVLLNLDEFVTKE